jgi:hypothetical protein
MLFLQNRQAMKSVFAILLIVAVLTITTGCRTNNQYCGDEFDVTTTIDRAETCRKTSCSLREAILKANTCIEDQTIRLREGVYTLSIPRVSGNSEVEENTGDLDIKNTIVILGAGKDRTIIDGNNIDRVFDIYLLNGAFINGVTIQNGNSADGGAIRVNEGASLVLTESKLLNNRSSRSFSGRGGAIYSGGVVTLSEVEVRGNSATSYGGGVYSLNGKLKILDSQFIENRAWVGGGLYSRNEIDNSDPTPRDDVLIRNCVFDQNEAKNEYASIPESVGPGNGGGLYVASRGQIEASIFTQNLVDGTGGGLLINKGIVEIRDVIVENNEAERGGGISNSGSTKIFRSIIRQNLASRGNGGGISAGGDTQIYESTIEGNTAKESTDPENIFGGRGGGISLGGIVVVSQSTINSNHAEYGGGGIYNLGGVITLLNSTVSDNTAARFGGGAMIFSRDGAFKNSTIVRNDAPEGAGVYISWSPLSPAWGTFNHSIIAYNGSGEFPEDCQDNRQEVFGQGIAIISIGFNILGDSSCTFEGAGDMMGVDPLLGDLELNNSDNSGITKTHLPLPGSPAINNGASTTSINMMQPKCMPEDQRGIERPKFGGAEGGRTCDIGAVEVKGATKIDLPEINPVDEVTP